MKSISNPRQRLCLTSALVLALALWPADRGAAARADEGDGSHLMAGLVQERCETWTPDAHATPVTNRAADGDVLASGNGTPLCCGGWQFVYKGVRGGQAYHFHAQVRHQGLDHARDCLLALVLWDRWKPTESRSGTTPWNYLAFKPSGPENAEFEAAVRAPAGATALTVRYAFRWSVHGRSTWTPPNIKETVLPERKPVKVCILTETRQTPQRIKIQPYAQGTDLPRDVAAAVDRWASLVAAACQRQPQLIVTPEIAVSGRGLVEGAVVVPGPATQPFEKLARENHTHIVLGLMERVGARQATTAAPQATAAASQAAGKTTAVYNSAVLIGPDGQIIGTYRKVHLATSEGLAGTVPGDRFPVFDTAIGRIGCLICMDTTVCESARMYGLQKADFICFPIMGDLRADRWTPGSPVFNEDRWKAIMRTRAIDNQLCMAVARNGAQGSTIINRKGDILAWNEGDQEIIEATVPVDAQYRMWDGGDVREITAALRRPHLYGAYLDEGR